MTFLANMVKTVRTFGAGVIMIDQDLEAFIGVEGAQAESMAAGLNIAAGQFIINNVSWTIAFGMKRDAAYRLADHYKDEILPSHASFWLEWAATTGTAKAWPSFAGAVKQTWCISNCVRLKRSIYLGVSRVVE